VAASRSLKTFSIGVDVGGTFTDVAIAHTDGVWRAKTPTTHGEIGQGVLIGLELAAGQSDRGLTNLLPAVDWFGLGTTAVTNVVAEGRGQRVGLLTTAGFEDELNLAGGVRFSIDGRVKGPDQIVPRTAIAGLGERIDRSGVVLRPLDVEEAAAAVDRLIRAAKVEALAVSLVNAYRNPAHEQQVVEIVRERHPGLWVAGGAALNPGFGFLQRTMFAVLNAFAASAFGGVDDLAETLAGLGLSAPIRLVNSTGGAIGLNGARAVPMVLMQSGPAAGAAAAAAWAERSNLGKVLACDMGGTSFDISVVNDGAPLRKLNAEILRVPTGMSMVDVDSIGAGGGSIGWADTRGMLRVGPRSAGSRPGPACYGWGGEEPTVTDALVVLGYINPDNFLGGRMTLDLDAAERACARLGEGLGLSAVETAWGIRRLAMADMTRAARLLLNRRGLNPADYTIVSYGGCGGLFNADIAQALGVRRVLTAETASVLSAFGAATAPIRRERSQAIVSGFPPSAEVVEAALSALGAAVTADLASDLVPEGDRQVTFEGALRFKRQQSELPIPMRTALSTADMIEALQQDFHTEYARRYGHSSILLGAPVELVTIRAIGSGRSRASMGTRNERTPIASYTPAHTRRRVWLSPDRGDDFVNVAAAADLRPGARIEGPACIDGFDTTIWAPPGSVATLDADRSLVIDIGPVETATQAREEAA
jgi:N-methylhydantoinase A